MRRRRGREEVEVRGKVLEVHLEKWIRNRTFCALMLPALEELKRRRSHPVWGYEPDDHPDRPQRGFHASGAPYRLVIGGNQCTALDTPLFSSRGLVSAAEVQVGDLVCGGRVVSRWVSPEPVGTYRIHCEGGWELTGNAEHPVMTKGGWDYLSRLSVGSEVWLSCEPLPPASSLMGAEDGYFAGLMTGDGCVVHHHGVMGFTSGDPELLHWVAQYVAKYAAVKTESPKEIRWCSQALKEKVLFLWGMPICLSKRKMVPREVTKDREVSRQFLRGYTDTDGCVYVGSKVKERQIIWISASKVLLQQIQQLLLTFGIYSSLTFAEKRLDGRCFPQWRLRARGPDADVFMRTIGVGLPRKAAKYRILDGQPREGKWVRVRDVSFCHKKHVIGFTVEPSNQYVTAGILSHNSGKSLAAAMEAVYALRGHSPFRAIRGPSRGYIVSALYRTIQEGVYRHLKERLPRWEIAAEGPMVPGTLLPSWIEMRNGARVDFLSGEGREDARRRIQAAAIGWAIVDEEVDEVLWKELLPRLMVSNGWIAISATLVRSEPWVLQLERRAESGDPKVQVFRFSSYRAAEAGHITTEKLQELESLFSDDDAEVRLRGKSRRRQGLVYSEVGREHICAPFPIPPEWTRYCSIDPGLRNFGVLWIAVEPKKRAYVYREIKMAPRNWQVAAEAIFAAEGYSYSADLRRWVTVEGKTENIQIRWMDPAGFRPSVNGEFGTAQLLAQEPYFLECAPAQNAVSVGIERVRGFFKPDMQGVPGLLIFSTCKKLIEEVFNYRYQYDDRGYKRHNAPELPIKRDDHLLDALRYACMGGLDYVAPREPDPLSDAGLAKVFGVDVLQSKQKTDHLRRLVGEFRTDRASVPHIGGLGTEY